MTTWRQIAGMTAVVTLLAVPASANLITNGTFDLFVPNSGTGGGWTTGNNDGAGGWRSTGGNPDEAFILNDGGAFASDPFIRQLVVGLTPGTLYRLTGDYRNVYACCGSRGPDTFAIDIDGVEVTTLDNPGSPATWGSFVWDFTNVDTDALIGFRAEINGDDTEFMIDNISLVEIPSEPQPVPEPSSLLLVGAGLAGAALRRRQR